MPLNQPGRKNKPRRIRVLSVDGDHWLDLLRGLNRSHLVECEHIPDDARVVGIVSNEVLNTIQLYVESAEFAEVPESLRAPEWNVSISVHWPRVGNRGELIFFHPDDYDAPRS